MSRKRMLWREAARIFRKAWSLCNKAERQLVKGRLFAALYGGQVSLVG